VDTYRSSTIELVVHNSIEKLLDDGSVRTSDLIEVLLDGEPFDLRQGLLLYERDIIGIVLIQRAAIPGEFFAIFIPVCKTLTFEVGTMADILTQAEHVSGFLP